MVVVMGGCGMGIKSSNFFSTLSSEVRSERCLLGSALTLYLLGCRKPRESRGEGGDSLGVQGSGCSPDRHYLLINTLPPRTQAS